ncbi:MAG: calcium/sodium antiporter [Nitrosopumilus sp.]|nr:calcium/sodium antiporter [Nitrosopumilus sp.]MDH3516080.1 calcium/sodium antiporter [Nitrosopumilus sp.]MDH3564567.1 calcium/sodium antiporter [Nitrosopumilus sp.]MDH5417495.1 calcium/sodium antiporter [Nitrosopumilus sp.]MDH5554690.1 calcium/sodium antiporter [Nitrosopumilus sp.]
MELIFNFLFVGGGLAMLYFGADWLVKGSIAISNKLGVSQLVIGLTVVAFGTSAPELAVSISSAIQGLSDVALGNVVGSNIVNIGVILGVSAVISPIIVSKSTIRKEIPLMIGISFLLFAIILDGKIDFIDGVLLVVGIIIFTWYSYRSSKKDADIEKIPVAQVLQKNVFSKSIIFMMAGLLLLIGGSFLTVDNAVIIGTSFGISKLFMGLTVVAIGTSLPELITSIVAARKGHADLAVGNIIGSNIFNIMAILGISSLISGITVSEQVLIDVGIMLAFSLVLIPIMRSGFIISRKEGIFLIAGYVGYVIFLFYRQ